MPKDKPLMDSADYLARRQGAVLRTLMQGIQKGGLDEETWLKVHTERLQEATRGHLSERAMSAVDYFTEHGFYRKPKRLLQLVKLLRREFGAVQRIYTNKGMLQLAPTEDTRYESTLSGEAPMMDEVPDWMIPAEEEDEK
ncbi:MAG: hypothetical protein ABIJ47_01880 [Candidatus Bathyarchaeota archaeon]